MDELNKLKDEIALTTSDLESIENSQCEDCSYSALRTLILRHENARECHRQVNNSKHLECDTKTVSAIRMIMIDLIKRGNIRIQELENELKNEIGNNGNSCRETHFTT